MCKAWINFPWSRLDQEEHESVIPVPWMLRLGGEHPGQMNVSGSLRKDKHILNGEAMLFLSPLSRLQKAATLWSSLVTEVQAVNEYGTIPSLCNRAVLLSFLSPD